MIIKEFRYLKWRRVIVSIFFCMTTTTLVPQSNLILNGDFEALNLYRFSGNTFYIDGREVEHPKGEFIFAFPWFVGNRDSIRKAAVSSSYWNFNDDSTTIGKTHYSNLGKANNGLAFSHLIPFKRVDKDIFETTHLVGRTCHPLIKDNSYQLSFWIRFSEGNTLIDHLKIFFSDQAHRRMGRQKVRFKRKKIIPLPDEPSPSPIEKLPVDCKIQIPESTVKGYQKVSCEYIARGGETYIYFGNLDYELPESVVKVTVADTGKKKWQTPFCYYYIDDVELVSQDESEICVDRKEEPLVTLTDTVVALISDQAPRPVLKKEIEIGDQYFASGSYELSDTNLSALQQILSANDYNDLAFIRITGHTDNVGTTESNSVLSLKRAEAISKVVQRYFSNIQIVGMGEEAPKYSNDTEAGRLKNRRVTLEFIYRVD